ncbi:hypothetical protein EDC94DRAFT_656473 [Helicostylum pulchrum]|nr:hypothetical protein EDC94DRAFT_656473 [Helicostylum pulchrum]
MSNLNNPFKELYHLHDHIIKLVEICGVIVGVEHRYSHINYTVDDNSGTIACYLWQKELLDDHTPLKLGDTVRVYGRIETGPEGRRVATSEILNLEDPNEELAHSVQTLVLDSEYKKPYELPEIIKDNKEMLLNKLSPRPQPQDVQEESETDTDLFRNAVFQFLRDNSMHAPFMISLPRRNAGLIDMAKEILSKEQENEPSNRQITHLFEEALTSLCEDRLVVESIDKLGMFEVVDEMAVEKFILRIIEEILRRSSTRVGGVREEYIMTRVKKEFPKLETEDIEKLMHHLSAKGFIFESGEKEWTKLR